MKTKQEIKPYQITAHELCDSPEYAKFGENRLGVLLLTLLTGNEDPANVAADGLVGGAHDKKIDAFLIHLPTKSAYVGQLYMSATWGKTSAPANKASDLNTATAWLFSNNSLRLSKTIADRSVELRRQIDSGEVLNIHMFYCHNCLESPGVKEELETVRESMQKRLHSEGLPNVQVSAVEYGLERITALLESDPNKLFVNESREISRTNSIYQQSEEWEAVTVTVDGGWLKELYNRHQSKLTAANFRDFMGATNRDRNINGGIKNTIDKEPSNFWVYNNGITILCEKMVKKAKKFAVAGLAVVNGAQTTGSFGEAPNTNDAKVLARFIRCKKKSLIHNIIKFNNTQNEIKPSDTRANDHVQVKLQREFKQLGLNYLMRRTDQRPSGNCVYSSVVGTALAAFHGNTQLAARNSRDIFLNDDSYVQVFRNDLTARHVSIVITLSAALDKLKRYLKDRVDEEKASPTEERTYEALRYSMSKHFIMSIIGALSADIVGTKITSLYALELRNIEGNPIQSLESAWYDVIRNLLPFVSDQISKLGDPYDVTRDVSNVLKVAKECATIIDLVRSANPKPLQKLKNKIL